MSRKTKPVVANETSDSSAATIKIPKSVPLISYLRFSFSAQALGDSTRRQLDRSDAWAARHGRTIADSDRYSDEGVSAYRGKHSAIGNLGRILRAIESGAIPRGAYLLIENLDRLSRQETMKAFRLVSDIIDHGIRIVTLDDSQEYSAATCAENPTLVMYLVMQLSRSNAESKRKSELVGAAWRNKRAKDATSGKAITAMCPAWLRKDGDAYVVVKDKAAIVKEIFALALKGWGRGKITRHLNKTYGGGLKKSPWSTTYVLNILRGRAVLGEYQPHKLTYREDGRRLRVPDGEAIKGYYPAVIDEETYYAVQRGLTQRQRTGGPTEDVCVNLFGGLMYDMEGLSLIQKSNDHWRRYYISSGRDGRGKAESYLAFPADAFDYALLFRLVDLQLDGDERKPSANPVEAIDGEIEAVDQRLAELGEAVLTKPLATLIAAIEKLEARKESLAAKRADMLAEQAQGRKTVGELFRDWLSVLEQIRKGELVGEKRLAIREALRRQVKRIDCHWNKDGGRDYVASLRVTLADWAAARMGESEIYVAFALRYVDYRTKGYDPKCPYEVEWLVEQAA